VIGKLSGVYVYPVKSMRGVSLQTGKLDAAGLSGDRLLMIMNKSGKRVTQLTCPRMAAIKATFVDHELVICHCNTLLLHGNCVPFYHCNLNDG
jgi:uncharacterized protein YcbX